MLGTPNIYYNKYICDKINLIKFVIANSRKHILVDTNTAEVAELMPRYATQLIIIINTNYLTTQVN